MYKIAVLEQGDVSVVSMSSRSQSNNNNDDAPPPTAEVNSRFTLQSDGKGSSSTKPVLIIDFTFATPRATIFVVPAVPADQG